MLAVIAAALAPSAALLAFFYLKDEFENEPLITVARCFLFGCLLVFPVMFIQFAFDEEGLLQSYFLTAFVQTALTEEFFKWFLVYFTVFHHVHFNERYDGIVYACAVALGFATVENIFYLLSAGVDQAFLRAVLPVSSHALFGVVMGYYLGKAKFSNKGKKTKAGLALLIPVILHGIYNFIILTQNYWTYAVIPFMIFLWVYALRKVKRANRMQAKYYSKYEAG
ncbi:glutamic-type intramembrane protease PrsW [Alteribacter natronophilus]|uniref:glutamic-type intramembrane protease PrsW n=1 Tax=Alteribacter natronophilus TaxID=2583810 RepID=UPI00110F1A9A|nr:glutamic-type intramembrane protease PrsW [Alteribacter natronophilus]TMW73621.1 intramembrane metalloprotease PrsW [Alteribacter natronophilus]